MQIIGFLVIVGLLSPIAAVVCIVAIVRNVKHLKAATEDEERSEYRNKVIVYSLVLACSILFFYSYMAMPT